MASVFLVGDAGTRGANSWASVQEYRDFFPGGLGYGDTDLSAIADTDLQRHLVIAAQFMGQLPWHGSTKQDAEDEYSGWPPRLPLPRYNLWVGKPCHYSLAGIAVVGDTVVPWVVKAAQIHLAEEQRTRQSLGQTELYRARTDRSEVLEEKKSLTESSKTWADPLAPRTYAVVEDLLRGLYHAGHSTPVIAI